MISQGKVKGFWRAAGRFGERVAGHMLRSWRYEGCQGVAMQNFEGKRADYFDAKEEAHLLFEGDGYCLMFYVASLFLCRESSLCS